MTDAELDEAVALAIWDNAVKMQVRFGSSFFNSWDKGCDKIPGPYPSFCTDWNHAMRAAEEFGLFVEQGFRLCQESKGHGREWIVYDERHERTPLRHKSGPRAICEAIVRLHNESE